jgi:putative MATE family efflux protein
MNSVDSHHDDAPAPQVPVPLDVTEASSLWRPIFRLAAPVLAEETLMLLVGYTDWWLTGQFLEGAEPKAAMALMSYMMWLMPSLFSAIAIGATAVIARRFGERRLGEANLAANQSLVLGAGIALVGTAVVLGSAGAVPTLMQLSTGSAALASEYLGIVSWVIPLIMCEQVVAASLRGAGDTLTGFLAKSIVVVVNLIVSAGLVTGWGPFPEWGWKGLAVGTACGHGLGGALLLLVFLYGRSGLKLRRQMLRPRGDVIRLLLRIGLPGGLDMAAILICQFAFVALINRMGDQAAAAHGLAVQIEALAYMPGSAFQVAAATLAGQFLGAGYPQLARRSAKMCLLCGGIIMCVAGGIYAVYGQGLAGLFTGPKAIETQETTATLLRIVAIGMPALAVCMIGAGTLRGAGDTRWPLITTLLGFCLVRLPLAIVLGWNLESAGELANTLPFWGWGVEGAWYAMVIDLYVRSFLIAGRLMHGGWQQIRLHR